MLIHTLNPFCYIKYNIVLSECQRPIERQLSVQSHNCITCANPIHTAASDTKVYGSSLTLETQCDWCTNSNVAATKSLVCLLTATSILTALLW